MKVFVDESGHSGADLYDLTQPVYSTAALWIDAEIEDSFCTAVQELRRIHKIQMPELKGSRLVKSGPGRRILCVLGELCLEFGVQVSLMAQHKPFMAAAVIIEDYTDYVYNPAFDPEWTWDTSKKESAAELVLNSVSKPVLMEWWRARRGNDLQRLQKAHNQLVEHLHRNPELHEFADAINRVDLADLHRVIQQVQNSEPNFEFSPNLTTFVQLIRGLNKQAEERSISQVFIIHDEQIEFQAAYFRAFENDKKATPMELRLPNGNTIKVPIDRIESIDFRESVTCIPLQVSDCLATIARVVVHSTIDPYAYPTSVLRQFHALMKAFFKTSSGESFPWVVGPLSWQPKAFAAIAGLSNISGSPI